MATAAEQANGNGRVTEKLVMWLGRAVALAVFIWAAAQRFSALETQGAQVLEELSKRPTAEGVENHVLKAVQPLTHGMAEVRVQLQHLAERVYRLEQSSNK